VDLSGTPRILKCHAPDEQSHFVGDARPAGSPPGAEPPVEAKALPVPAHDRLGLDDDQDLPPARPELAQQDPETAVQGRERGSPSGLAEDRELLAEGELDEGLLTLAAEAGDRRQLLLPVDANYSCRPWVSSSLFLNPTKGHQR